MTGVDWAKIEPSEALAELMRHDADREPDEPIGGWRGEWAVQRTEPPPVLPQPLVIEPPPWAAEETGPPVPLASPAPTPTPTALEVMRAEDGDSEWAPPPGPPLVLEPLVRPLPP